MLLVRQMATLFGISAFSFRLVREQHCLLACLRPRRILLITDWRVCVVHLLGTWHCVAHDLQQEVTTSVQGVPPLALITPSCSSQNLQLAIPRTHQSMVLRHCQQQRGT